MWATGRYTLRLSEREFWRLTPREFAALLERREENARRADWRAAVSVIWLLAPYVDKGRRIDPADIFPTLPPSPERDPQARIWYPGAKKKR